jgi:hypothetical protein
MKLQQSQKNEEIKDSHLLSRRKLVGLEITPSAYECMTPTNIAPAKLKDIKNFQLLAKSGEGAIGKVYRALHTST